LGDCLYGIEQSELVGQVEIRDGFVKQEGLAIMDGPSGLDLRQGPRELDPTLFPAG
jgi:hypothetical protein